jgi:hypothetical protein
MSTRIQPVRSDESADPEINQLLRDGNEGWWHDSEMFGVIARRPGLLKTIVPVFVEFFGKGIVEPYLLEMMRIKTGEVNRCAY